MDSYMLIGIRDGSAQNNVFWPVTAARHPKADGLPPGQAVDAFTPFSNTHH
jgi:hypothetical protein